MKLIHRNIDEFSFKRDKEDAIVNFLKKEFDIDAEYDYRDFLVHKGTHERISNRVLRDIKCPDNLKLLSEVIGDFLEKMKINKEDYVTTTEYDVLKIFLDNYGNVIFVCVDDAGKVKTFNNQQDIKVIKEANDNKNIE